MPVLTATDHTVYTRAAWSDDWVEVGDLFCEEGVWAAAPSIPTATLHWYYGFIMPTGSVAFGEVLKKALNRVYVRVVFDLDYDFETETYNTREWVGVVEVSEDAQLGAIATPEDPFDAKVFSGEQVFTAYAMDHLLDRQYVNHSFIDKDDAGDIQRIERALVFNRDGLPNRSAELSGGTYHFSNVASTAEHWTTRDIVQYLIRYFSPRDADDESAIGTLLYLGEMLDCVPDFDAPEINPENRSTYSLLVSLVPRQRLASFYARVNTDTNSIEIVPFSFTELDIPTLEGEAAIPANTRQKDLVHTGDQSGEVTVKTTTVDRFNQIVVRGARGRAVASFAYNDTTLEKGWTDAEEEEYEAGASGIAGYADLDTDEKRRSNAAARARDSVRRVWSRFSLPHPWDGEAGDGVGGDKLPVFVDVDLETFAETAIDHYDLELTVEQSLPLLEGVDYEGPPALVDEDQVRGEERELPPQVFWKRPDNAKWCNIERLADPGPLLDEDAQNDEWSASVSVPRHEGHGGRAIEIRVSGAPQHVLDHVDFDALAADEEFGEGNWRNMIATLSLQHDGYAEAKWPTDDVLAGLGLEEVRRLYVYAGDRYRFDYIVPETVVGVDDDGTLLRSDGGTLHDDRLKLQAIAKVANAYYNRERAVLWYATDQLTSAYEIGDLIDELKDHVDGSVMQSIHTPITEIRIQTSRGTPEAPPDPARMRISTDSGSLDALALFDGRTPEPMDVQPAKTLREEMRALSPSTSARLREAASRPLSPSTSDDPAWQFPTALSPSTRRRLEEAARNFRFSDE